MFVCVSVQVLALCVFVCDCDFECQATPINTVMAHRNLRHTARLPENSFPLNQNVLFIQANRFSVNCFIEIALRVYYISL